MKEIYFLPILFLCIFCKGENTNNKQNERKLFTPNIANESKMTRIDGTSWLPLDVVCSLYYGAQYDAKYISESFPFELIYMENWNDGKIYFEGLTSDLRNIDVQKINDTCFYVKKELLSYINYKNKNDSLLISIVNKKYLYICTTTDTIKYVRGIKDYDFTCSTQNEILKIKYLRKEMKILDSEKVVVEDNIKFNLKSNTVENSQLFSDFSLTPYYSYNYTLKCWHRIIRLDTIRYFLSIRNDTLLLRNETKDRASSSNQYTTDYYLVTH